MIETLHCCPLCNSNELGIVYENVYDYLNMKDEFYIISKCLICSHNFTSKRIKESHISSYYENAYYTHANISNGVLSTIKKLIFSDDIMPNFNKSSKNIIKVLDVGCGNGFFLRKCSDKGLETVGLELDSVAVQFAKKNSPKSVIINGVLDCEFVSKYDNYFDYVNLSHVLEHIYDVDQFLDNLTKVMKSGSYIVIDVPRFNCFESKLFRGYWRGLELPRHIHHFTKSRLIDLAENHSLYYVDHRYSNLPMCTVDSIFFVLRYKFHLRITKGFFFKILYYLLYPVEKIFSCVSSNTMSITFRISK